MVDVDRFKTYNDRYGHPAGDRCLATVAAALQGAASRPEDFVARYGGEEMVMLLPKTDSAGAYHVAERARRAVLASEISHEDSEFNKVSASFGVAAWRIDGSKPASSLLEDADQALYAAKAAGRNRVVIHGG